MKQKQAYIAVSAANKTVVQPQLDAICELLAKEQIIPLVFANTWTFSGDQEQEMMHQARSAIAASDLLIAECSHKAVGVGVEVGYAAALDKPIIYVRHIDAEHSTTVSGTATHRILYEDIPDLEHQLTDILDRLAL